MYYQFTHARVQKKKENAEVNARSLGRVVQESINFITYNLYFLLWRLYRLHIENTKKFISISDEYSYSAFLTRFNEAKY